ncbi:hypothetical protein F4777DRAFT_576001 [Nemania sp. FL0916]|nr:hypothetical protein F4777DRAFT_576001 [Nemania sp. FL0916]
MHSATITHLALAAVLNIARADFDIYRQGIGGNGISGNSWGWMAYDSPPACDSVTEWIWRSSSDVSGGKYGVRCEGDGCGAGQDPAQITTLEMNFNSDDKHFTFYQGRANGLFDLDGNQVGSCTVLMAEDFYCGISGGMADGSPALSCNAPISAADIQQQP